MRTFRFDVIIIGAGPAGSACAHTLAKGGKKALLVERGLPTGSKNLSGGRLYSYALELLEPGLTAKAPLERSIVREQIMMLDQDRGFCLDFFEPALHADIPHSCSVLRAPFDEWLAAYAEEQGGATLVDGIKIDEILWQDGHVTGVRSGDDTVEADTVVIAEGVLGQLAETAGLRPKLPAQQVGVGIKEVISLPANVIEERFQVASGQGAARVIAGGTAGIPGGGFLYTNKESLSLGLVFHPEEAAKQNRPLAELFQEFKMHPAIYPLLAGGATVEYGAHLVPEAGWRGMPPSLHRPGLLLVGDAAGFVINTGTIIRGMDLAIVSGIAAARAILASESPQALGSQYLAELQQCGLLPTMKILAGWPELLGNPRMVSTYPAMANAMLHTMFHVDGAVPPSMPKAMKEVLQAHISLGTLLKDLWKGVRAL